MRSTAIQCENRVLEYTSKANNETEKKRQKKMVRRNQTKRTSMMKHGNLLKCIAFARNIPGENRNLLV